MTKLQHRHFVVIAKAVATMKASNDNVAAIAALTSNPKATFTKTMTKDLIEQLALMSDPVNQTEAVRALAGRLSRTNPQFSFQRFYSACDNDPCNGRDK